MQGQRRLCRRTVDGGNDRAIALVNAGWKRTSLKVGDKVTIYVNPLRNAVTLKDGSQGGLYVGAILQGGEKLGRTDGKGAGSAN
jgi:hypothetical protein